MSVTNINKERVVKNQHVPKKIGETLTLSPTSIPLVYFFSISYLYTDNLFPVLLFVLFASIVLLEPTRPLNPK